MTLEEIIVRCAPVSTNAPNNRVSPSAVRVIATATFKRIWLLVIAVAKVGMGDDLQRGGEYAEMSGLLPDSLHRKIAQPEFLAADGVGVTHVVVDFDDFAIMHQDNPPWWVRSRSCRYFSL